MEKIKYDSLTLVPNEDGTAYCIAECDKNAVNVNIPVQVNGIYIDAILENAFEGCSKLKSVTFDMPSSEQIENDQVLTSIGSYAFSKCTALEKIDLPDYVVTVDRGAFYGCHSLESVTFNSYAYIGPFAFYECVKLKHCSPIGGIVCEGTFYQCEGLTDLPINKETTEIDEEAFGHCYGLTDVVLPKSIKRIEALAFRGCHNLKSVVFENTSKWYSINCYFDKESELDLTDPQANAQALSQMDFDDGVIDWHTK